jgi:DNA-directed RNA polymerase subunit beta'
VKGEGLIFSNAREVVFAYQHGQVSMHAAIKIRLSSADGDASDGIVDTTVGRVLLYEILPEGASFNWINKAMKQKDLVKLISKLFRRCGQEETVRVLDEIKRLGFSNATLGGISLAIDDLIVPGKKKEIIGKCEKEVDKVEKLYRDGAITNGERYNKVIQIWARATEDLAQEVIRELEDQDREVCINKNKKAEKFNPVFMMLDSGARGSRQQIRQLGGMRGLMAKPPGEIMETPVLANFKGGLTVFEYFISTHGARKGLADTALKTADSGYLTRRLVDVAQDVIVNKDDCNTLGYINVSDLKESGNIIESLSDRLYGRFVAEDVKDPVTGKLVLRQGCMVCQDLISKVKESAVTEVAVRSVLTCQSKRGVCAKCYGMDLSTLKVVDVGSPVGIIAAQSIGEPGTQLTMRTFHIGGTASGLLEQNFHRVSFEGKIQYRGVQLVTRKDGSQLVINRKARVAVVSDDGRELEVFDVEYGATVFVKDGEIVKEGKKIAEWDSHKVIVSEKGGTASLVDLVENITYREEFGEDSEQSYKTVLAIRDEKHQPCVVIKKDDGEEEIRYYLPTGAMLYIEEGDMVGPGDVLAKLPREEKRTKDITGGLPRVAELFEARIPKDIAVIADVDGTVQFGGIHRGHRRITLTADDGEVFEYSIPRNKHLNVEDGDRANAGDALTSGTPNVHDILRILGPDELQKYLVKEIQEIYTLQGVTIHDRHIELIVRQMLKKVSIVDPGDTSFVIGDRVGRLNLQSVNKIMAKDSKKVAISKPLLMGITKASLGTASFFSAASFQETTRVLTEAAVMGQVDYLYGLKENVIIGKLIPAGTGVSSFKLKFLGEDVSELEEQARYEEELEVGLDKISLTR